MKGGFHDYRLIIFGSGKQLFPGWKSAQPHDDDRAVYCSCQKQTSYTFRGYVLKRDVTKFQGYTLLAV